MANYIDELFEQIVQVNWVKECDEDDECKASAYILLDLCGGIPDNSLANITMNITITSSCMYEVEIISDLYYLNRLINFDDRIIHNFLMRVALPNTGIGTHLFFNQVIAARNNSFTELFTSAAEGKGFNGYYYWGKLGYTMTAFDKIRFHNWCIYNSLKPCSLHEILSTEEGRTKWINNGFGWSGIFKIEGESENIRILRQYLSLKAHFNGLMQLL